MATPYPTTQRKKSSRPHYSEPVPSAADPKLIPADTADHTELIPADMADSKVSSSDIAQPKVSTADREDPKLSTADTADSKVSTADMADHTELIPADTTDPILSTADTADPKLSLASTSAAQPQVSPDNTEYPKLIPADTVYPKVIPDCAAQPSLSIASASQPRVSLASAAQPRVSLASASQPRVSLASAAQPRVSLASATQPEMDLSVANPNVNQGYQPYHHFRTSFFLLRLPISFNGVQCTTSFSSEGHLVLSCPDQPAISISFVDLVAHVERIVVDYGVTKVTNCWCDDTPLFELSFTREDGLRRFVHSIPAVCQKLSSAILSNAMKIHQIQLQSLKPTPEALSSIDNPWSESDPVVAEAALVLMTPGVDGENLLIEPVTVENYQKCFSQWQLGVRFEFRDVMRRFRLDPSQFSGHVAITLSRLVDELRELTTWQSLGLALDIPEHYLTEIRLDFTNKTEDQKREMLSRWLKLTEPKWIDLVRALRSMGEDTLAKRIARKYGIEFPMLEQLEPSVEEEPTKKKKNNLFRNDKVKKQTEEVRIKDTSLQQTLQMLEKEMNSKEVIQNEVQELRGTLDKYENEKKRLSSEKESLEKALQMKESELEKMQTTKEEVIQLRTKLEMIQSSLKCKLDEAERLRMTLSNKEQELARLSGRLEELERTKEEQREELCQLRAQVEDLLLKQSESTLSISDAEHIANLETEQLLIDTQRRAGEVQIDVLTEDLRRRDAYINQLQEQVARLQSTLDEQQNEDAFVVIGPDSRSLCPVCQQQTPTEHQVALPVCGHFVCKACFRAGLTQQIHNQAVERLSCPVCGEPEISRYDNRALQDLYFEPLLRLARLYLEERDCQILLNKISQWQGERQTLQYSHLGFANAIEVESSPRHRRRASLGDQCPICWNDVFPTEVVELPVCGHAICLTCFQQNYEIVTRGESVRRFTCPVCGEPKISRLTEDSRTWYFVKIATLVHHHLPKEVYQLCVERLTTFSLLNDPDFIRCPNPSCQTGFLRKSKCLMQLKCPECDTRICSSCKTLWEGQHEGVSCQRFKTLRRNQSRRHLTQRHGQEIATYLSRYGIECPNCHFQYELARGGCLHFKCKNCPLDFCSGCSQLLKHGMYCGKYPSCANKGLHAHHPRDCLYYMEGFTVEQLQSFLQGNRITFETRDRETDRGPLDVPRCRVMLQKDMDGLVDEECGGQVSDNHAGLCRKHYQEYLVDMINKHNLDPIELYSTDEIKRMLEREEITPPSDKDRDNLIKFAREVLPPLVNWNEVGTGIAPSTANYILSEYEVTASYVQVNEAEVLVPQPPAATPSNSRPRSTISCAIS